MCGPVVHAKIAYFHNDLLGSPLAATDAAGSVIWTAAYRPFGSRDQDTDSYIDSLPNRRWFTGHVEDADSGLIYMQGRYYDPGVGRFVSADPAAVRPNDPGSFNRYAYALNNPYRYIDPDGRDALTVSFDGSFILGAGLAAGQGIYATYPGQDDAPYDIGVFSSSSVGAGADVALMGSVGMLRGGRENVEGLAVTTSVTVPLTGLAGPSVDYESIVNVHTGEWAGQSVGAGVSAFPSASVAVTKTQVTFSLRDFMGSGEIANPNTQQDQAEQEALMWYGFIAG